MFSYNMQMKRSIYFRQSSQYSNHLLKLCFFKSKFFTINFCVFQFELFAGGLNSLVGTSSDDGGEEEATAGMEITLAGVQLRQIIFFTGQGELMGHVWSGTASERTSALQVLDAAVTF